MKISKVSIAALVGLIVLASAQDSCPIYKCEKGKHHKRDKGEGEDEPPATDIQCLKTDTNPDTGVETITVLGCPHHMKCNTDTALCEEENYEDMYMAFFEKTKNPGSFCEIDKDCRSKNCVNYRCAGATEGENCRRDYDCDTPFYCESRKCAMLKTPGMVCSEDSECAQYALCNSDGKCAALFSLEVGMPANDYTLCESLNLDEEAGLCAPALHRVHNKNSDVCTYKNPETKEIFENANAVEVCPYCESGKKQCEVGTADEIIRQIVMQAQGFVKLIEEYGTNCHKDDGLLCAHGANEGFEENPLEKMEEKEGEEEEEGEEGKDKDCDKKDKKDREEKEKWEWIIKAALSVKLASNKEDLINRASKFIENNHKTACVNWTFDPELQYAIYEHREHFPWLMVAGGSALAIGAGAAAYYFFFYQSSSSV